MIAAPPLLSVCVPTLTRYEVDHVCNLTDIDDKIIKRMARDGVSLQDLTGKYTQLFFDDLAALNILPATRYPKATEHMDDIVNMIQVARLFDICLSVDCGWLID